MAQKNDQKDLCINCFNIDHCSYYPNQKGPVTFCEEFACDGPKASSSQKHSFEDGETRPTDKKKQGLCINCRQMNSCIWDKTPEKFYCEEYE